MGDELPLRALIRRLLQPGEKLYAVVDGARDRKLATDPLAYHGLPTYSLFQGPAAHTLEDVAPRLVPLDVGSGYLERWSAHLGRSAGILLISREERPPLWQHLRGIFVVTDGDKNEYFFRFFDPRVLRPYVKTCTANDADELFGPIRLILVETDAPGSLLACSAGEEGVRVEEMRLGA